MADLTEHSATPSPISSSSLPELPTPITESEAHDSQTQAVLAGEDQTVGGPLPKKKKKKKSKKAGKSKDSEAKAAETESRPPLLCISRNKHWRYISSYHGPWLQLPLELLESLLVLNADPGTLQAESRASQLLPPLLNGHTGNGKGRERDLISSEASHNTLPPLPPPPLPSPKPGKATPPPIDPGVFRSVTTIRDLIDEASELSVRASSGLNNGSPWGAAQSLGMNPLGGNGGGGRNVAMSAMRIHRLRALAVQKLAEAYKTDEIASSVMVMQGGSVFDDLAERVLRNEPNDPDARYVHFFHEKIPSRQLAESTTSKVLDELIAQFPQRLQYYRTRGIVHCFREDFTLATKDFTHALKEARAIRKAKQAHHASNMKKESRSSKSGKRRKNNSTANCNGQAPPDGTSVMDSSDGADGGLVVHPSVLPDAPEPIEPQLLFLRGAAYLQHAVHLIETAVLDLEGVTKAPSLDGAELRLCYLDNGKYGGVEIGNPDGPLGSNQGRKVKAYNQVLGEPSFREHVNSLLKKSIRDHEKFLAHFDTLEPPHPFPDGDIASRVDYAFNLSDTKRTSLTDIPPIFTTYHPLLVESLYSVLICLLMLGRFDTLLPQFVRTATMVDGLEGYPIFLPPRSMGQAEFIEILERPRWGRLAIEPPPLRVAPSRTSSMSSVHSPSRPSSTTTSSSRNGSFAAGSSSSVGTPTGRDTFDTSGSFSSFSSNSIFESLAEGTATPSSSTEFGEGRYSASSSTSANGSRSPSPLPNVMQREDAAQALDYARMLLAPVVKRQKDRAEKAAAEKAAGGKRKPTPINIPLHGPRVEVVLAWLAAVHLPELDI
ncbi:hypothetical protein BKA70DRAFT_1269566 [Coprinopsis sp. MPI-PUGE-AT-0042]|nr:hypothetical protein BKA70DRAFT_1269566 [Coprinopsis sp. MPI-PUGE-AT-0042]